MSNSVLSQVRKLLAEAGVEFEELEHPPTYTSEESAAMRSEELGLGAKALLLKTDGVFRLFILPANRKLESAAIKRELRVKKIRFATPDELKEMTGLVPGSVPPFGHPVFSFELYADETVGELFDRLAFNAGTLTNSIIMSAHDWAAIARPRRFSFSKAIES